MVAVRIILIILFFVVLLNKPTYVLFECTDENDESGTVFWRLPLIVVLCLKIRSKNNIIIINRQLYDLLLEQFDQEIEKEQDE